MSEAGCPLNRTGPPCAHSLHCVVQGQRLLTFALGTSPVFTLPLDKNDLQQTLWSIITFSWIAILFTEKEIFLPQIQAFNFLQWHLKQASSYVFKLYRYCKYTICNTHKKFCNVSTIQVLPCSWDHEKLNKWPPAPLTWVHLVPLLHPLPASCPPFSPKNPCFLSFSYFNSLNHHEFYLFVSWSDFSYLTKRYYYCFAFAVFFSFPA